MQSCVIVGGGVLGTMHAYGAIKRGFRVIHLEKTSEPSAASVRNFGLIWVSGRAAGRETDIALRARQIWGEIGNEVPGTGFRAHGSLTLAKNESELQVILNALSLPDASAKGFEFLDSKSLHQHEPAISSRILGALLCTSDAIVEPQRILPAVRNFLAKSDHYSWLPDTEITDIEIFRETLKITSQDGRRYESEFGVIAPGADHAGVFRDFFNVPELRRVRLQMASIDGQGISLKHSIADGDSLRYYPAFKNCGLDLLPAQDAVAKRFHMQLLLSQRLDGSMTIGDTHEYEEPFEEMLLDEPYDYLASVIEEIFGIKPRFLRKWDGIYSQVFNTDELYFRRELTPRIHVISGLGGRGNTISPAVAEDTFELWRKAS